MAETRINESNIFSWLVRGSLLLSAVLGAAGALLFSPRFGASLFVGGLLALANFFWIRAGLEAALRLQPRNASRFAIMRYVLRLAIMAAFLYLLIVVLKADIFGLVIGLSVLVLNIIAFSIYLSTRKGG
ncbi:ATP synthase subunit I [Geomonas subterranea]|uniref:ATP synthase subunit I n=1 Tax=Geomonas subterranea TaxID=2847989 RepID=A0ABX8LHL3_9BACT|nr:MULTISPECIES: ATP synthase subunit I [Geomonas]QXE90164.1 ATP synthase subunit I [Geomonas subterranea]QXM07709.1 ATP synthase subunit I [Geomonas subterranea]